MKGFKKTINAINYYRLNPKHWVAEDLNEGSRIAELEAEAARADADADWLGRELKRECLLREKVAAQRDAAQAELRQIREAINADPEESTLDEVVRLADFVKDIIALEDKLWMPVQAFRSDEQVMRDEAKHELACELAEKARALLGGGE